MGKYADKKQDNKNTSVVNTASQRQSGHDPAAGFSDQRPETTASKGLQTAANNNPKTQQLKAFQDMANNSPQVKQAAQLQAMADHHSMHQQAPVQKKENKTGLPDHLKTGAEALSGYSMDDVKVHYNSSQPAQLNAHAYAQGTDIHVAPGQEKHLAHETWHVVQQKQGRVKPTLQMKGKVNVNDDAGLEKEADVMGEKIQAKQNMEKGFALQPKSKKPIKDHTAQRVLRINNTDRDDAYVDALNADDFAGVLHGVAMARVKNLLKSWIVLSGLKNFGNDQQAVTRAVGDLEDKDEAAGDDATSYIFDDYTAAGFTSDQIDVLHSRLGNDDMDTLSTPAGLLQLQSVYVNHGVDIIERFLVLNLQAFSNALAQVANFANLLDDISPQKLIGFIQNLTIARINTLFANMTADHVNQLQVSQAEALAAQPAPFVAAVEANFNALIPSWLADVAGIAVLVGGGYTVANCAALAGRGLTLAQATTLQGDTASFVVLNQFIGEAFRHHLTIQDILQITNANVGATFLVLQGVAKGEALARIDKNNHFASWIHTLSILITEDAYTLSITASHLLPHGDATYERTVTVRNAVPNNVGTFVIHYHPGAQEANVHAHNASPKHIKPVGNAGATRLTWPEIPDSVRGLLPNNH